jgi:hypothetical protein
MVMHLRPQLLEELVQKRDNARGLSRLDGFVCLKHVRRLINFIPASIVSQLSDACTAAVD